MPRWAIKSESDIEEIWHDLDNPDDVRIVQKQLPPTLHEPPAVSIIPPLAVSPLVKSPSIRAAIVASACTCTLIELGLHIATRLL